MAEYPKSEKSGLGVSAGPGIRQVGHIHRTQPGDLVVSGACTETVLERSCCRTSLRALGAGNFIVAGSGDVVKSAGVDAARL